MLTNEILSSIDNIDDCVMEAEMNVINAMINEYDKAVMIMENYNGDSYDCFDIFQEGFKDEVNKPVRGIKGENILKRILMAIPRLIALLIKKVKKFFNKEKHERIVKNLETIKRVKVKDINKLKIRINKRTKTNSVSSNPVETISDNDQTSEVNNNKNSEEINNMVEDLVEKKVMKTNLKFDVISDNNQVSEVDLDEGSEEINNMVEDLVEKKVVKTDLKFDVIKEYLDDCFESYGRINDVFRKFSNLSDEEKDRDDNINRTIRDLDEYMDKCKNKPCMQHKSEHDVRSYITSSDKHEYPINEIGIFIENVDFRLHEWSGLDINKLNNDLTEIIDDLKEDQKNLQKFQDKWAFLKPYIHRGNLEIKIYQQLLIVVPIVAKIVDEEFDKWDKATKKAVGLIKED